MAAWSNIALLEHVNLNIDLSLTSLADVRSLFCGALGMLEDPRPAERGRAASLLWANCGLSQVHLPCDAAAEAGAAAAAAAPSQRVDGCIGVLLPRGALAAGGAGGGLPSGAAPPALLALRARASPCLYLPASPATLGNAYLLEEADAADAQHGAAMAAAGARPHPCLPPAPPARGCLALGLTMVQLRVPAEALPHVADFFTAVLGARVEARGGAVLVACDGVAVASHGRQALLFTAAEGEGAAAAPPLLPYDGWHAALYLRDFRGAWEAARAGGLLYDNPRFSDRCGTWAQALEHQQFRTRLLGADSGVALELELRSLAHPHCPLPRAQGAAAAPPRVLSIQSHVVWGRVGNCAATLPLQALGWEVSPLNTVHLATHTGYGAPAGQRLGAQDVAAVLGGLREHGLLGGYSALLTGYTPSGALLGAYTALAAELAAARAQAGAPPLLYVCDPVLGDEEERPRAGGGGGGGGGAGRLYVPRELIPSFAAHIAASRPTILTPNAFEAAQLTGRAAGIGSVGEALEALEALHALGARCVVMTSTWIEPSEGAFLLLASAPWEDVAGEGGAGEGGAGGGAVALAAGAQRRPAALFAQPSAGAPSRHCRFALRVPRLPLAFTGTGDLTAALLLANYAALPGRFVSAVERSVAGVRSACWRTAVALAAAPPGVGAGRGARAAAAELRVLEARGDFAEPVLPGDMQAFAL
jgi:pyridoxine kinase